MINCKQKNIKKTQGFSLMELMIVVAIVAILSVVAFPSYTQYILEARRTDGMEAALLCSAALKKEFTVLGRFDDGAAPNDCTGNSQDGYYSLRVQPLNRNNFTVRAIPRESQAQDLECGQLRISNTGRQTITGNGNVDECWK